METVEAFASETRDVLHKGPLLPGEEKRDILEMLPSERESQSIVIFGLKDGLEKVATI